MKGVFLWPKEQKQRLGKREEIVKAYIAEKFSRAEAARRVPSVIDTKARMDQTPRTELEKTQIEIELAVIKASKTIQNTA